MKYNYSSNCSKRRTSIKSARQRKNHSQEVLEIDKQSFNNQHSQIDFPIDGFAGEDSNGQKLWIVQSIQGKKKVKGKTFYLVEWFGYDFSQNTWEMKSNLQDLEVKKLIMKYEKSIKKRKQNSQKRSFKQKQQQQEIQKINQNQETPIQQLEELNTQQNQENNFKILIEQGTQASLSFQNVIYCDKSVQTSQEAMINHEESNKPKINFINNSDSQVKNNEEMKEEEQSQNIQVNFSDLEGGYTISQLEKVYVVPNVSHRIEMKQDKPELRVNFEFPYYSLEYPYQQVPLILRNYLDDYILKVLNK